MVDIVLKKQSVGSRWRNMRRRRILGVVTYKCTMNRLSIIRETSFSSLVRSQNVVRQL